MEDNDFVPVGVNFGLNDQFQPMYGEDYCEPDYLNANEESIPFTFSTFDEQGAPHNSNFFNHDESNPLQENFLHEQGQFDTLERKQAAYYVKHEDALDDQNSNPLSMSSTPAALSTSTTGAAASTEDSQSQLNQSMMMNEIQSMSQFMQGPNQSPYYSSSRQDKIVQRKQKVNERKEKVNLLKKKIKKELAPSEDAATVEDDEEGISDKKSQQMIKNRISAQRSRDLKKQEVSSLHEQIQQLTFEIQTLYSKNQQLTNALQSKICVRCSAEDYSSTVDIAENVMSDEDTVFQRSKGLFNKFSMPSAMSAVLFIALIMALSMPHTSVEHQSLIQIPNQSNVLVLKQSPPPSFSTTSSRVTQKCQSDGVNGTDSSNMMKLIELSGKDISRINFNTKIVDSHASHESQFALKVYNEELAETLGDQVKEGDQFSEQEDSNQRQQNTLPINTQQQNDQIFCSNPTIFHNGQAKEELSANPYIDVIYSTENSNNFTSFGDQYFQLKPDGTNKYVHLTCRVVSYFSRELPA